MSAIALVACFAAATLPGLAVAAPPPSISRLIPAGAFAGDPAFTLTIQGNFFQSGAVAEWDGGALTTTFHTGGEVVAAVSAAMVATAGLHGVVVRNPDLQASSSVTFSVNPPPAPSLSSLSPSSASPGGASFTLTVSGFDFKSGATVLWDGSSLTTGFVSGFQVQATVPAAKIASPGTAQVSVENPDTQVSNELTFTIAYPPPSISALTPSSATTGGPAFTLTVDGSDFQSGAVVSWDGSNLTTSFVNSTQVTAAVSAARIATAGLKAIVVTNPDLQASTAANFGVSDPPPSISSLVPSSAVVGSGNFSLTVNGSDFVSGATIVWNFTDLSTGFASSSQLVATVGGGLITSVGSANVRVRNLDGQYSNSKTFSIVAAPPSAVLLSPSFTTAGAPGFSMTVNGTDFQSGAVVTWNGGDLSMVSVTASKAVATVTAALVASPGSAAVRVRNPDTQLSGPLTFTINAPAPTTTGLTPATAEEAGAGFTLTVSGTNFLSGAVVTWGSDDLSTTYSSATQVTAAVSAARIASPTSVTVKVRNPDNQLSNAQTFTVTAHPPRLTTLNPSAALLFTPGLLLTVNGSNFFPGSTVFWNLAPQTSVFVNPGQMLAVIPSTEFLAPSILPVQVLNPDFQMSAPLLFVVGSTVDVDASPVVPRELGLAPPRPNPAHGDVSFAFGLPVAGNIDMAVFSSNGRRVRSLLSGPMPAGTFTARWDGHDDGGRPAASGIYWVRLSTPLGRRTRSVVLEH